MFLGEYKNPVKVNISQFYGIEVNDFAVTVAKTALWIAESQMLEETSKIVYANIDFLPLKTNASIIEANSITYDWNDLVRKSSLNYIMGNPPFHAARRMSEEQHRDMNYIAKDFPKNGELDYVACWYIKAALYMKNTRIKAGFVSTSSICQGEQVSLLWKKLFNDYDLDIFYAIRSFNWVSEASKKAGVHCIIIEFTIGNQIKDKIIEENGIKHPAKHINGYLINYDDKWIENRKAPICDVPTISNGSKPLDNAICAFTTEEKDDFIKKEPASAPYFYRYMGSKEFVQNIPRWFLFCNRIPETERAKMPMVIQKLKEVSEYRRASKSEQTYKLADTPEKFHFENVPTTNYLAIPQTSSGKRRYVPIGFLGPEVLANNKLQIMTGGGLYEFGILSSNIHNAWVRTVAGRLRDDITYSVGVVYNTFPWPIPTEAQRNEIERTAQLILDARSQYKDFSLKDMYGEDMFLRFAKLHTAHQQNDLAVMKAYGFIKIGKDGKKHLMDESECLVELFKMYEKSTQ